MYYVYTHSTSVASYKHYLFNIGIKEICLLNKAVFRRSVLRGGMKAVVEGWGVYILGYHSIFPTSKVVDNALPHYFSHP